MRPSCAEHQTFQNPRKVKFLCPGSRHQNSVAPYLPECYIKFIVGFLVLVIEATNPKSCHVITLTRSSNSCKSSLSYHFPRLVKGKQASRQKDGVHNSQYQLKTSTFEMFRFSIFYSSEIALFIH